MIHRKPSAPFLFSILAFAACNPAIALTEIGLSVTEEDYGDVNTAITANTTGIYGAATTKDLYIGNINSDITVGDFSRWAGITGIKIAWGQNSCGVHFQNIAETATIDVKSKTHATGIDLGRSSQMGDILGDLIVTGLDNSATGITAMNSVNIGAITGLIDVRSDNGYAQGIFIQSDTHTGSISGNINVHSTNGKVQGIGLNHSSSIADFSGTLTATSTIGSVTGISIEGSSTIGEASGKGIGGTINVSSTQGVATGIYLTSQKFNVITGNVNVTSEHEAVGINLSNDAQLGTIGKDAVINVTLSSNGSNAGNAYGIKAEDLIGNEAGYNISDIEGTFKIVNNTSSEDATLGNAYGIYMIGDGGMGTISSDQVHNSTSSIIVETVDTDKAYGVYAQTAKTIYFEGGATIKASSTSDRSHGYAIYNDTHGITVAEASTSKGGDAFLSGNLYAGDKSLVFQSGDYQVSSDNWTASNIVLGATSSTAALQTAHVTVTDIMTTNATSIDFYLNTVEDFSQLTVNAGGAFDLSSINEVNFHFSQEFIEVWGVDYFNKISLATGALTVQDMEHITVNMYGEGLVETEYIISDSEISIFILPEPSTATMSIIALIALMSRRRRRSSVIS